MFDGVVQGRGRYMKIGPFETEQDAKELAEGLSLALSAFFGRDFGGDITAEPTRRDWACIVTNGLSSQVYGPMTLDEVRLFHSRHPEWQILDRMLYEPELKGD